MLAVLVHFENAAYRLWYIAVGVAGTLTPAGVVDRICANTASRLKLVLLTIAGLVSISDASVRLQLAARSLSDCAVSGTASEHAATPRPTANRIRFCICVLRRIKSSAPQQARDHTATHAN